MKITRAQKWYGWSPDIPDHRDIIYQPSIIKSQPGIVDLRPQCPPVYDQGSLGSCSAQAIAAALEFDQMKQNLPERFVPSRLFIYYNERSIEHTILSDSGAQLRDGIKSVAKQGVCPETEWPYVITKFAKKPPKKCFEDAIIHKAMKYMRIDRGLFMLKNCLAAGYPFIFGFTVYESFEDDVVAQTGMMSLPHINENVEGSHAICAVGFDEFKQVFIVRNSWGEEWGDKGYFYMPYQYLIDSRLSDDFWTIRLVQ